MPKLTIRKSIEINASPDVVFAVVSDLSQFRVWNPWLVCEPDAEVTVTKGGKAYAWKGTRIGEGEMHVTHEQSPSDVHFDLTFFTPHKSSSKVGIEVKPSGDKSTVTWTMDGSLPFFLFFMTKMMTQMLGMDYQRGLTMLRAHIETGKVPSNLEFRGETTFGAVKYVGVATECAIDDLGQKMSADFERLRAWQTETNTELSGDAFSIYKKWDLTGGRVHYLSGLAVKSLPQDIPAGFTTGSIPNLKTYVVHHVGAYEHLGNAWSAGMNLARSQVFAQTKAHPPFETYGTLPGDVNERGHRVSIHFPIK